MRNKNSAVAYYMVEEGIPIPPRRRATANPNTPPLPLAEMRVGDSFLLPRGVSSDSLKRRIFSYMKRYTARTNQPINFNMRTFEDGTIRVWRVL